jgi:hypothetical protein
LADPPLEPLPHIEIEGFQPADVDQRIEILVARVLRAADHVFAVPISASANRSSAFWGVLFSAE